MSLIFSPCQTGLYDSTSGDRVLMSAVMTRQFWSLIPMAFAVLADTALARSYLNCPTKKVVIADAPNGSTSSSMEENLGLWIDEAAKIVTLADGRALIVRRFDDRWISAASGDVSYELDRQNGNLTYAGSMMKDGIATTTVGAGRCTVATVPVR
jgi:hypothetical protein